LVDKYKLNTICAYQEAAQTWENVSEGTANFLCDFRKYLYAVLWLLWCKTGRPEDVDWDEPEKWHASSNSMSIKHAVITSVDRDDIKIWGSIIWAETVKSYSQNEPTTTLETLIPDFQGKYKKY
jgi:lipoic acid synthetase